MNYPNEVIILGVILLACFLIILLAAPGAIKKPHVCEPCYDMQYTPGEIRAYLLRFVCLSTTGRVLLTPNLTLLEALRKIETISEGIHLEKDERKGKKHRYLVVLEWPGEPGRTDEGEIEATSPGLAILIAQSRAERATEGAEPGPTFTPISVTLLS